MLVATSAFLMVLDAADFGPIRHFRTSALSMGRPVSGMLSVVTGPIATGWNGIFHYDDLRAENDALRQRVAALEGEQLNHGAAQSELTALLEATELSHVGDIERVTARVVADRETPTDRIVEINKGSDHGLVPAMPVVTESGLVGRLGVVTGNRSTIELLTSDDVVVGIRSGGALALSVGASGVERGALSNDVARLESRGALLQVEFSPQLQDRFDASEIGDGALFVTSGLSDSRYPAGIPVGHLRTSGSQPVIDSTANIDQLRFVSILLTESET